VVSFWYSTCMNKPYTHERLEKKWQKEWEKKKLYKTVNNVKGKSNEMVLVEFPYPSGNLHVGHWYAFALPDIYARYRRMTGKNVMYPIGFDAFGLPAENAAIKNKINPKTWTYKNMAHMRKQIASMGTMFDWSREVVTCDPAYYKWTQKLFLDLYKKGLVYRKPTVANWCPSCKTVLANEQVVSDTCERCGSTVDQRELPQWNIAITKYADRLIDDLDTLDWPHAVKESQKNWIGRSEGAEVSFKLTVDSLQVTVFTTRVDTIYGATFLVVAPEHPILKSLESVIANTEEIQKYIEHASHKTDLERQENKEKSGVKIEGVQAINPATGKSIPIFIADYVLAHYGTGAIMAVPAHDERDAAFALKYNLSSIDVVEKDGTLINSGQFTGQNAGESKKAIMEHVCGKAKKTYRLHDWIASRQRYWGVPIPMIYCKACDAKKTGTGYHPVPEKELPVVLPRVDDYLPTGDGKSPLAKASRWVKVKCPACKATAERETDTLDTFFCSSWYYLRYADPKNTKQFASAEALKAWVPVDLYCGGAEHTTMHLLYSRFWHKALYDLKMVPNKEPYIKRVNRGIILGPDGQKMSKSKGNVIDPDSVVELLGTDTVRMYLAFIGPYNEVGSYPWNSDSIAGVRRFLERVWKLQYALVKKSTEGVEVELHKTIKKVTDDVAKLQFNTAIAAMMTFLNVAEKGGGEGGTSVLTETQYTTLLRLVAPFAPHMAEEIWHVLGHRTSIHLEKWPTYNKKKIATATIEIGVQINGKLRAAISISPDDAQADVLEKAKKAVEKWLEGQTLVKEMYVQGKIVSLVVKN
jgi:leucyl-tRNA synthetase